jgi:sugar transferase (PEP-CTERM/EpsH1 system associated)
MEHLLAQGHSISVCTPTHDTEDIRSIAQLKTRMGVDVVHAPLGHSFPRLLQGLILFRTLSVSNFYSKRLQKKLDLFLQGTRFDIILCTSSSMAEYVFRSRAISSMDPGQNEPLLLMDFMDLDSDKWRQYSHTSSWPMSWIYRREAYLLSRYEHRIQKTFRHCFLISQNEVDLFNRNIGAADNVHVLGNGINSHSFYPPDTAPQNDAPVFIFTGVMDYKPNVEAVHWFMDNAWGLIKEKYPEARFIIAGMNPVESIRKLEPLPGIEVTGYVDEILPYYHQADYFVAPFTIARGVQNKILQAFACGLPVITTSMGAEGIKCVDDRDVIIAETGSGYLQAVDSLEADKERKQQISDSALKLINDHYSWQGQLKPLDELINNLHRQ